MYDFFKPPQTRTECPANGMALLLPKIYISLSLSRPNNFFGTMVITWMITLNQFFCKFFNLKFFNHLM